MISNNMKKAIVLALLLVIFLMPVVSANSELSFVSVDYNPSPVEKGSSFTLSANVKNTGTTTAEGISCTLDIGYGFSLNSGSKINSLGSLDTGKSRTLEYTIGVFSNLAGGTYTLTLNCIDNSGVAVSKDLEVYVEVKYGLLNVVNVKTIPEIIEPGQEAVLSLTLENTADDSMNEISIKLNLTGIDIAPSGESAEKKLRSIGARSSRDVLFNIRALPEIAGGIYKIPLKMTYDGATTKSYELDSYLSVEVGSTPQIDAIVDSSTIYGSKTNGEITIKLINRGLTDIKLLNIQIDEADGFDILSADSVYVGDLDSDDYETAEFSIKVGRWKGEITIPATIEFRDSSNNFYSEQKNITFRKLTAAEAGQNSISPWLIIVVLALIGFLYYRYRKNKKGKEK